MCATNALHTDDCLGVIHILHKVLKGGRGYGVHRGGMVFGHHYVTHTIVSSLSYHIFNSKIVRVILRSQENDILKPKSALISHN